jgi:hypothetical protein
VVHHRRLRFYVGTADEVRAPVTGIITLCGRQWLLDPVADHVEVDCKSCLAAAKTQAHLP